MKRCVSWFFYAKEKFFSIQHWIGTALDRRLPAAYHPAHHKSTLARAPQRLSAKMGIFSH
jgi:hypothetical protein